MKHLGDITKIDGAKVPKVDIITFGAPCTDLSVAGCEPAWASEIEEFPIAVTKKHFGNEETGEKGDVDKYL